MPSAHETQASRRQQGRAALENYLYIRPYDYPTLHRFLDDLERRYDILKSFAGDMSDRVRIWYCLNMMEEADPHWENRLHAFKSRRIPKTKHKKKLEKVEWELFLDWDCFKKQMADRGGEMNFREPLEAGEERPKPKPKSKSSAPSAPQMTTAPVVQQPSIDKLSPAQSAEKQAAETQLPIRLAPTATASSSPPLTNTTSEATSAGFVIVKDVSAKDASAKDKPVKVLNGKSRQIAQIGSNGIEAASKTSAAATTAKLDEPTSKTWATVNKLGDDEDYVDIPEGGYADDVNYEDVDDATVDNDRDEKDIVHVNGEVRYHIPGYASRKKQRQTLISAPRFIIKKFFRSKFPGRPRCSDCGCQHPTERYMLCSNCDFCHVGGDQECYHQHPELRGTRPDKDKYRQPASPCSELDLEVLSDVESDSKTIKGDNDDTVKIDNSSKTDNSDVKRAVDDDLTNSLGSLSILEQNVDKIEFVRDQAPEAFVFNSPQATPAAKKAAEASDPIPKVRLPIRTTDDKKSTKTQEVAQPVSSKEVTESNEKAADDVSQITAKLESVSISVPSPAPTSAPTLAAKPAPTLVSILAPIAATPAAAPVRNRQAVLSALSAPSPVPSATLSKTDTAEGGAPLNADNLARVPHDQSHRRWASMSSLTTSSSGESLIAFRRRRTNQVKKKTAAKEASDNAAAEKAAAEKAAAEKAEMEEAEARAAIANKTRLEVEQRLRRERETEQEAKRLAQIARDRPDREARLAQKEEQRIANKKAKAARKRERQKERRREREEEERLEQEQGWGHTSSTLMDEYLIERGMSQVRAESGADSEEAQKLESLLRSMGDLGGLGPIAGTDYAPYYRSR